MARASFGGAADYSQYFQQLYNDYAQRLEANANEAIRNAEEEQAALDEDAANRWQAGEMSDAEWIAYVKRRLAETRDDEEMQTYWKDALRDSEDTITQKRIEKGVRDLQNKIDEGKATYKDLRAYLIRERARVKEGSPIYDQLSESIDQVGDTIRDQAAEGEIARAGYLFQSGQISGSAAAAMVRKAAERYKNSDPARYWNLMSQSYDLTTAGASGGYGGGGGGGASLSNAIDLLEYEADAIDYLNDQFKNGKKIGTLPDGSEVVLGDESGNPAEVWSQIDDRMVEVLQAQYEAKVENGDRDAVEALQRLEKYVETTVQPRNTIPQERQFGVLTNSLQKSIELAQVDPERGAKAIADSIKLMERWAGKLNTTTKTEFKEGVSEGTAENPELSAAARRTTVVEADELDQTTGDFASDAKAFVEAARAALDGGANLTPQQAQALVGAAGGLMDQSMATQLLGGINEATVRAVGLTDGSWTQVQMPNGEIAVVQMVPTAVDGPDGKAVTGMRPDLSSLGVDPDRQEAAMVLRRIGGKTKLVWAVGDYAAINKTTQNPDGERVLAMSDGQGGLAYRNEDGSWTAGGRNVPIPAFGMSSWEAQRWVNSNPEVAAQTLQASGIDPQSVDMKNLYAKTEHIDTFDRFREQERQTGVQPRGASATPQGQFDPRNMGGTMPQQVKKAASDLGINFEVQSRNAGLDRSLSSLARPISVKSVRSFQNKKPLAPNLGFNPEALRQQLANIGRPRTVGRGVQVGGNPNGPNVTIN